MIHVKDAIQIVTNSSIELSTIETSVIDALNCYLATDVFSKMDMPPFNQSAMDGYAICGETETDTYTVIGEIKAGDTHTFSLNNGEAFRIFTGAMIPSNTTSIAKQEIVSRTDNTIKLTEPIKKGVSIRRQGEELNTGDLVIKKGTKITPAAIGLLSGLGIEKIKTIKKPAITLIVTGNELTQLGEELVLGKIYESNSYTIQSALLDAGFESTIILVKDDYQATKDTIEKAIKLSNLVIMTGGISVGDYDFVGKALNEIGVTQLFYKVKQKPGKPLYYGEKDKVKIFALPGNPAAALTCFYVYVLTAIKSMMGSDNPTLISRTATITHDYTKNGERAHLLKAKVKGNKVNVHKGQSSAMLSSFVDANCFLFIDSEVNSLSKGDTVEVLLLP